MSTSTIPTLTRLQALEDLFRGSAWLAEEEQDDRKLARIATEIVHEDFRRKLEADPKANECASNGAKVLELAQMLPPAENTTSWQLPMTRSYLWEMLVRAYMFAKDPGKRGEFARELLALPIPTPSLRGKFETTIRESLSAEYCSVPCLNLLSLANAGDNKIVIRKAWQSIGTDMVEDGLLFASACLRAMVAKHSDPAMFRAIAGGECVEFVERMAGLVNAALNLRDHLPKKLGTEGGTSVKIVSGGTSVAYHWKTVPREQKAMAEEIEYLEKTVRPSVEECVRKWRRENPREAFEVHLYLHLMPHVWTPGHHMQAEHTIHHVIER